MLDEYWYRYTDYKTAPPLDEWDFPSGPSRSVIRVDKFKVLKRTPKGVRVQAADGKGGTRWIKRDAKRRYACPTEEEALESFVARKLRQKSILQNQIQHVDKVIVLAKQKSFKGSTNAIRQLDAGSTD